MHPYPDPKIYLQTYLARAICRYIQGVHQAGVQPNATLERAVYERALREAGERYTEEITAIRDYNINQILAHQQQERQAIIAAYQRRIAKIRRRVARRRLRWCLPLVVALAVVTALQWWGGDPVLIAMSSACTLTYLLLVVGAYLWNRPDHEEAAPDDEIMDRKEQ